MASGKQNIAPILRTRIVEVKEGTLGGSVGIVDRNPMPVLRDETVHHLLVQRFAGQDHTR